MNFKHIGFVMAAAAALLAQGAHAQTPAADTKTRAEVKAETATAKKLGEMAKADNGEGKTKASTTPTKPRAEVKAETAAAAKKGELPKGTEGEGATKASTKPTKTRAEVKAETKDAMKQGTMPNGEGATMPVKK